MSQMANLLLVIMSSGIQLVEGLNVLVHLKKCIHMNSEVPCSGEGSSMGDVTVEGADMCDTHIQLHCEGLMTPSLPIRYRPGGPRRI
jgi:hypothetical protein